MCPSPQDCNEVLEETEELGSTWEGKAWTMYCKEIYVRVVNLPQIVLWVSV